MTFIQNGDDSIFLCGKKLTKNEVASLRETIRSFSGSEVFINPIEKLVDKNVYSDLNEENRFRYVLELSSIYVYLKNTNK